MATGFISKISADGTTLIYSTYLGSASGYATCNSIAVDGQGSVYVTGDTTATSFPLVNPFQSTVSGGNGSAFVTKLNASGSALEYSTYLSGKSGASGQGIAVDGNGAAYVAGYTGGDDFPTVNPFNTKSGIFVSKFSPTGSSLEYSTRLGVGVGEDGFVQEQGFAIAVDPIGEAMVTGYCNSSNFPLRNPIPSTTVQMGSERTVVAKLNSSGSGLVFSTYLDLGEGRGIATNASGDAFVTGYRLINYPDGNQTVPVFVARIKANGFAAVYSTDLNLYGVPTPALAVDASGNAYITGSIDNSGSNNPYGEDAYLGKLDPTGASLLYTTSFGGRLNDYGRGIATDGKGNVYLAGGTYSPDFPLKAALQPNRLASTTAETGFVIKMSGLTPTDFAITNSVDKTTVGPGGDLHYTITLTNIDSDPTAGGTLSITSPRNYFRTCQVSNGDPCHLTPLIGQAAVDLTPLPMGASRTIAIYATAAKTAGDNNTITNTATFFSSPLHDGYSAYSTTTVRDTADMSLSTSAVESIGGLLHYVHTVSNLGPDNAHAVLLLNPLPAGTTFVSASTTLGQCSFDPSVGAYGGARCPLNNPTAGNSVKVDVFLQATKAACPAVSNAASIISQSIDSNSANDATTVVTQLPTSVCN